MNARYSWVGQAAFETKTNIDCDVPVISEMVGFVSLKLKVQRCAFYLD